MKILFINGSPNKDGNTKALAVTLLKGHEYETLNLVDYQIGVYGQKIADDQFGEVLDKVKKADVLQYLRGSENDAGSVLWAGYIRKP